MSDAVVWVVERCHDYEGCRVIAVVSSLELAREAVHEEPDVAERRHLYGDRFHVRPWNVDDGRPGREGLDITPFYEPKKDA